MIFGLPALFFVGILLSAFIAGMLGAFTVLILMRKKYKSKKNARNQVNMRDRNNWNRLSRDEQLYNGR